MHHTGEKPPFYFWRDKTGNEIDLVVDIGSKLLPIEIKASKTYSPELKTNIFSWLDLKNNTSEKGFAIYGGEEVVGKRISYRLGHDCNAFNKTLAFLKAKL